MADEVPPHLDIGVNSLDTNMKNEVINTSASKSVTFHSGAKGFTSEGSKINIGTYRCEDGTYITDGVPKPEHVAFLNHAINVKLRDDEITIQGKERIDVFNGVDGLELTNGTMNVGIPTAVLNAAKQRSAQSQAQIPPNYASQPFVDHYTNYRPSYPSYRPYQVPGPMPMPMPMSVPYDPNFQQFGPSNGSGQTLGSSPATTEVFSESILAKRTKKPKNLK